MTKNNLPTKPHPMSKIDLSHIEEELRDSRILKASTNQAELILFSLKANEKICLSCSNYRYNSSICKLLDKRVQPNNICIRYYPKDKSPSIRKER